MCVQMWREDGMCVSGTLPVVSAVEVLHPRSHIRSVPCYGMSCANQPSWHIPWLSAMKVDLMLTLLNLSMIDTHAPFATWQHENQC